LGASWDGVSGYLWQQKQAVRNGVYPEILRLYFLQLHPVICGSTMQSCLENFNNKNQIDQIQDRIDYKDRPQTKYITLNIQAMSCSDDWEVFKAKSRSRSDLRSDQSKIPPPKREFLWLSNSQAFYQYPTFVHLIEIGLLWHTEILKDKF
jgi:hypothetical protein